MDSSNEFRNATILIVDDAPENIDVLNDLLKTYKRKATTKGAQALAIAKSAAPPDLILLDVMMPEIDGFEVCRLLKNDENTKNIPVIFMTSLADEENKVKGFRSGAVDYITKPIQAKEVLARVETHLKLYFLERQLKDTNQILELKVKERTAELVKARETAEESNRMKSHFMLLMNHEIRTPLAGIIGFTQILTDETANNQHKGFLLRVQNSALRLKNTLDAILNLTRLESNLEAPEYTDVSITNLLQTQAAYFQPLALEKNIEITAPDSENDLIVQTDAAVLEIIIKNLIDNAVKYTPQGKIMLDLAEEGFGSNKRLVIRI
ncbi:MAG: response regulator, partial [Syntrophothermus sp.]